MAERLTDTEIAEIEARAQAATAAPWVYDEDTIQHAVPGADPVLACCWWGDPATTEFIAHARTDVPRLIAALRESRAREAELRETVEDLVGQFAYQTRQQGRAALGTGGLSALEWAFRVLGWPDPKPVPEGECQAAECHEWATCGRPTTDGYKRLCGPHDRQAARAAAPAPPAEPQEGE